MKNRISIKYTALFFSILVVLTSCNDWLDVKPRSQEDAEELYDTPEGFKSALAGIYTTLTGTELYGRELTFGMVSVLGQEWARSGGHFGTLSFYTYLSQYNYEQSSVETAFGNAWKRLYFAIAECNTLISYTEKNRGVLNDLQYNIIRGEGIALRAFAHAELFRLFGKISNEPAKQKAIPYIDEISVGIHPQLTNQEFFRSLDRDIEDAISLLETDPIRTMTDMSQVEGGYYVNRQFHLNYFAVLALKARMQLHRGDKSGAARTAGQVIEAQTAERFDWIDQARINTVSALKDRTFSTEHIFSLNIMLLKDYISGYFRDTETSLLTPRVANFDNNDIRAYLFESYNGVSNVFGKFWQMDTPSGQDPAPKYRMPIIRISEMYFIAAEAQLETNPAEALRLLNIVRSNRNEHELSDEILQSPGVLVNEFLTEYQKEFLGEGQLWYYHKRNNTQRIYASDAKYIIPIPADELEYGNVELID